MLECGTARRILVVVFIHGGSGKNISHIDHRRREMRKVEDKVSYYNRRCETFHQNLIRFYHFRLIGPNLEIMPHGGVSLAIMKHGIGHAVVAARCALKDQFCKFEARYTIAIRYEVFFTSGAPPTFPVFIIDKRPSYEQLKQFAWHILYDYTPADQKYLDLLDPSLTTISHWKRELEEKRGGI